LSCHGFCGAFFPLKRLQQKFTTKIACTANSRNALTEMNSLSGWYGFRKSYWVGS